MLRILIPVVLLVIGLAGGIGAGIFLGGGEEEVAADSESSEEGDAVEGQGTGNDHDGDEHNGEGDQSTGGDYSNAPNTHLRIYIQPRNVRDRGIH